MAGARAKLAVAGPGGEANQWGAWPRASSISHWARPERGQDAAKAREARLDTQRAWEAMEAMVAGARHREDGERGHKTEHEKGKIEEKLTLRHKEANERLRSSRPAGI